MLTWSSRHLFSSRVGRRLGRNGGSELRFGETDTWLRTQEIEFICLKISKFSIRGMSLNPLVKRDQCYAHIKVSATEIILWKIAPQNFITRTLCIFFVYFYITSTKINKKLKYTTKYFQFETV